jgi:hypothetical protein
MRLTSHLLACEALIDIELLPQRTAPFLTDGAGIRERGNEHEQVTAGLAAFRDGRSMTGSGAP